MLNNIKYKQLEDGSKAVAYIGNIEDFTPEGTPLDKTTIVIEKYFAAKLTLFDLRPAIRTVAFPDNIQEIGKKAFFGNSIKEINLPDKCKFLLDNAFENNEIEKLNLNKCEYIGNYCFYNNKIKTLILPSTVIYIGKEAFKSNCIEEIYMSEGLKYFDEGIFVYNNVKKIYVTTYFAKKFPGFVKSYKNIIKIINSNNIINELSTEKTFKEINEILRIWKI